MEAGSCSRITAVTDAPSAADSAQGMRETQLDEKTYRALEQRVGRVHLRQRLGIETDYEARIFGQGRNFFHLENWYSVHSVIRNTLRLLLLHRRGKRNARAIRIRNNDISIQNLPEALDGYTLLHLTDLHLDLDEDMPRVLIDAVRQIDYHVCVLTGDFRANTFGSFEAALNSMKQVRLHLKDPLYGVLGNHDTIRMVPSLEAMGISMLLNEAVTLPVNGHEIHLAGVDDPHYYRADNMEKAADGIPHEAISILLAHSPEVYRHAAYADFDLMLCGHSHGGQICLPGGVPIMCNGRYPRALCSGPWQYNGLLGYTSVGSGSCIVDVRLNCPPEITLHRLRRA